MLDHEHGVAEVAQVAERAEQARIVALVQADGGLVEHVENAGEPRADLRGEADALALAAGERAGGAGEGEVFQPDIDQELQPLVDLLQDAPGDLALLRGERVVERREPARGVGNGEARDLADVRAPDLDAQRLRLQPMAAAAFARGGALKLAELIAQPGAVGFAPAAIQVGHHAFEGLGRAVLADAVVVGEGDPLLAGALEDGLPHLLRQLAPGDGHARAVVADDALQRLLVIGRRRAGPGGDGASCQAEAMVRHHEVGVEIEADAEAVAARAGTERVVEGEEPGLDLLDGEARDRAGELGREDRPLAALRVLRDDQPVGEPEAGLQAVGEPGAERGRDHHAVHHHLDVVLALLVEGGCGVHVVNLAVDLDPGEAPLEQLGELFPVLALAAPDHRREQVKPRALRHRQDAVDHLAHGLALDGEPGRRRIGHADAGEEQPQVVVDLGDRAHGRARVPRRGLLLDGDRRREPVDRLHVGLLHQLQELPRIGREALDVAPLALGVDRVEGEGGFARA